MCHKEWFAKSSDITIFEPPSGVARGSKQMLTLTIGTGLLEYLLGINIELIGLSTENKTQMT
jgi:hypothetical protein